MGLPHILSHEQKENLIYLFNLTKVRDVYHSTANDVKHGDTRSFLEFCMQELDPRIHLIDHIYHLVNGESHMIEFEFMTSLREKIKGSLLSENNKYALKELVNGELIIKRTLVAKIENNNTYLYLEKDST